MCRVEKGRDKEREMERWGVRRGYMGRDKDKEGEREI